MENSNNEPCKYIMDSDEFPGSEMLENDFRSEFLYFYNKFIYQDCTASMDEAHEIKKVLSNLKSVFKEMKEIYEKH